MSILLTSKFLACAGLCLVFYIPRFSRFFLVVCFLRLWANFKSHGTKFIGEMYSGPISGDKRFCLRSVLFGPQYISTKKTSCNP